MFPGSGGFDRRVQRQQVGLICNCRDLLHRISYMPVALLNCQHADFRLAHAVSAALHLTCTIDRLHFELPHLQVSFINLLQYLLHRLIELLHGIGLLASIPIDTLAALANITQREL